MPMFNETHSFFCIEFFCVGLPRKIFPQLSPPDGSPPASVCVCVSLFTVKRHRNQTILSDGVMFWFAVVVVEGVVVVEVYSV